MKSRRTLTRIPLGEWLPDQPAIGNPGLIAAKNVFPLTAESYGPMSTLVVRSDNALTTECRGYFHLRDTEGIGYDVAADTERLWMKQVLDDTFVDVSQTALTYQPDGGVFRMWSIAAFGDRIIAANGFNAVQTFLARTDTEFSDLDADAPLGTFVAVIRDFTFLANIADTSYFRVHWSGIGDPTSWLTPGTDAAVQEQSDYQELDTALGTISGIVGGGIGSIDGAIWCDNGIHRVAYVGSPAIFEFRAADGAPGTVSPRSIVRVQAAGRSGSGALAFYVGHDMKFYAFDGASATSIGAQKFDNLFRSELKEGQLNYVLSAYDPEHKLVLWAFTSSEASARQYDRLLVYNWDLQRAALCELESPVQWLDTRLQEGFLYRPLAFDADGYIAAFEGDAMAPEIVTGDRQMFAGRRAKIQSVRPLYDGGTASVAVAMRNLPTDSVTYQTSVPINVLGECPQRVNGRYARFKLTLPAAGSFTQLHGLEVAAAPEGMRR